VDAFNAMHGEVLVKPQILLCMSSYKMHTIGNFNTALASAKRVMSLKEPVSKMSKSHGDPRSRIHINDQPADIARKIRLALTDSIEGISYEPNIRPGVSNLLEIMSSLDPRGKSPSELAGTYKNSGMREFKEEVSEIVIEGLAGIRDRYEHLTNASNSHYLEDVAQEGSRKAHRRAAATLVAVREAIGLF